MQIELRLISIKNKMKNEKDKHMKINSYQKRTWAEVLVENVKFNFDVIKSTATNSKVCCVIKANAYGHGAVKLAKIYQEKGADFLAVSNIEEANIPL